MKKKTIMVLGILALVISTILLSGCASLMNSNFDVYHDGATLTINKMNEPLKLIVTGNNNDVSVAREIMILSIMISGENNIVRVSNDHVNFSSRITGANSQIVHYD